MSSSIHIHLHQEQATQIANPSKLNMAQTVESPPTSLSLRGRDVLEGGCTLQIRCHDRHFRGATVNNETGDRLFILNSKGPFMSWSLRRTLQSTSGHHIWDLRHYRTKMKQWVVENAQGKKLCTVQDGTFIGGNFTAADARIHSDTGYTLVSMKSFDHAGSRTVFQVEGITIAEMLLTENNDLSFLHKRGLDRTIWDLRIAGGVDIALILALAFCRCEISHAWRRQGFTVQSHASARCPPAPVAGDRPNAEDALLNREISLPC